ncbi:DUF262 domain-containing protein [Phycisphaeraceae bacterium D3-23]
MGKAERTVEELVGQIERGELRLPEMQRRYVWQATRVRDLLDSLYRGYPSGAILVWETDEEVPERDFAVNQSNNSYSTSKLLLDGQQRLTSLLAVVRGKPITVRGRKKPIDLLFNLDHPEHRSFATEVHEKKEKNDQDASPDANEDDIQKRLADFTFIVSTKQYAAKPNWVSVTEVFGSPDNKSFLKRAGILDLDDPRLAKYSDRLNRLRSIKQYVYRLDILERSLTYEEVTEIFVRVNSLGSKLRSSDLAMAQITAKWRDSLKIFEAFRTECEKSGFLLESGIHLKNLVAFATGQSRFKVVANLDIARIKEAWEPSKKGMEFALNFCESNARLDSPALLSSPFLLITLGCYGHHVGYNLSTEDEAKLRSWLYLANMKGRYSRGSTETLLDQDLNTISDGDGVSGLINTLESQFGRLDVLPSDLVGRTQRSALFKTMFLAFRDDGAKDWEKPLGISLSHRGKVHRLQFHHIFPRAVLKGHYKNSEVNDICNLAFIGGTTNRRISSKKPLDYLLPLIEKIGHAPFKAQCIPTDKSLFSLDAYPEFLKVRRKLVSARLNSLLAESGALR